MRVNILVMFWTIGFWAVSWSQLMQKPSALEQSTLPAWAQVMYSENPNVYQVDSLYQSYYSSHAFEKNYHTQYYKRWRRSVSNRMDESGFVVVKSIEQELAEQQYYLEQISSSRAANWSLVGPVQNTRNQGDQGSGQANIYALDQNYANPDILYCGTEPGEVYKSIDRGISWVNVSMGEDFGSGVSAIASSRQNPDLVFAGSDRGVFRSQDGGISWEHVLVQSQFSANEFLMFNTQPGVILCASNRGLFRSIDFGDNWTQLYVQRTYDLKSKPGNEATVYMVKNNPALIRCEFFTSTDFGATWTIQTNGWYSSSDPARTDGGARIAVSDADPERVYAYLIGEAKAGDLGYIGLFRSNDGGQSWILPNGPTGGPYSQNHPNLAIGWPGWDYHQGFYNCALMASNSDADNVLIGGLNLWRSADGGYTFSSVAGYVGGPLDMHVDMQDFRETPFDTWITTDGGIYHSSDYFDAQPDFLMTGVHASDYWGFGSGWNADVLVGGLYHNGNLAWYEPYGEGIFLELGGGEAPTGYVNPGDNKRTYFSDIQGAYLPENVTDPIQYFSIGMSPNESYWAAESSEMEFHPNCYQIAYIGKDNKLWRTQDGGASYSVVHTFGNSANNQVKYIEIASSNPQVIYLNQQPSSGSTGLLWKTIDGGQNWTQLTLPSGNSRRMLLAINPENALDLTIAYPSGSNGNKLFRTTNGGTSWVNITSPLFDNQSIQALTFIAGANAIYVGTNQAVYHRSSSGTWNIENSGLPTFTSVNIMRPFYRDGKLRLASYGKGIWETELVEQPAYPIARITVDKLTQHVLCDVEPFNFDDYSFLNHQGASRQWTFPTGVPASSTERNPSVQFNAEGLHLAVLTITDQFGQQDTDSLWVELNFYTPQGIVFETFEGDFLPEGFFVYDENNGGQWSAYSGTGGFGTSERCAIFDNYNIDSQGTKDDLIVVLNGTELFPPQLTFDVAYTPWGTVNSDTLEVRIANSCIDEGVLVYRKGGIELSTRPAYQDYFVPGTGEWREESISLTDYLGQEQLFVRFRNIGNWGNALYLDNIRIGQNLGMTTLNQPALILYPNPAESGEAIHVVWREEDYKLRILEMNGKVISQHYGHGKSFIPLHSTLKSGVYIIQLETENQLINKQLVIQAN
jgi:photosystem II stability/assembly factor-like uncharacterized protein